MNLKKAIKAALLPEITVDSGSLVDHARKALKFRAESAEAEALEKVSKEQMILESEALRESKLATDEFIGMVRVVCGPEAPPVRVEFRINNGTLEVTQESELDKVFGGVRPMLWSRGKVISEIPDPTGLIASLTKAGMNPWDYLSISVKDEMDEVVSQHPGTVTAEALMPVKGFIAKVNEVVQALSAEAREFLKVYLKGVLKPTPVLGTAKGSKS